ncbi:lipopolysaccharide kinase InaA family protein [Alloalcanivorax sp. C16-2]|uniref:lipopolysaccharide kinase InaA family protein n=1 Tax=Alloalcanivorax sp. C16-2 TaxID=3390052 RepID=UPI003970C691
MSEPAALRRSSGGWWVDRNCRSLFPDWQALESLESRLVASSSLSRVVYSRQSDEGYFIKTYQRGGGHLHDWIGTPRVAGEWRNLLYFQRLGLPVPEPVVFGVERRRGRFRRGVLVTREVPGSTDLARLAVDGDPRLRQRDWLCAVGRQVADALARMHADRFCHGDMKWRNLLVKENGGPRVYFFDCPAGRRWRGPFLTRRRVKDLACLDKLGREHLSRTDRLRFYLRYKRLDRLTPASKREIARIEHYFDGCR